MRTSIYDVAREAGVSISMVSRVVRGVGGVRAEKRDKVQAVIRRLGYHPSPAARGLRGQKTRTVGLMFNWITPELVDVPLFREIIAAAFKASLRRGYYVLLNNIANLLFTEEDAYQRKHLLYENRVDGMLVVAPSASLLSSIKAAPYESLLLLRQEPGFACVDFDQHAAMEQVVAHLHAKGHRRIGLFCGHLEDDASARPRLEGFRAAMAKRGLELSDELLFKGHFTQASGREGAQYFLGLKNPPTAWVTMSDYTAIGALEGARESGAKVPAITGFDDLPAASDPAHELTTVRQDYAQLGASAAEFLFDRLEGRQEKPALRLLPSPLIVRQSA